MKSRCTYCGSTDYGKGCRFGPHSTHLHMSNGHLCAFCGSSSFGRGCKLNPTSDLHVHGINFNSMFKESLQSFLDESFLLKYILSDFKDLECYKQGIINDKGNKIKEPLTENETNSYGPFIKTIIKIKKYLGSKIDLLAAENALLKESVYYNNTNVVDQVKYLKYEKKVEENINNLYKIIDEAHSEGLSLTAIKKAIKA